MSKRAPTQQRVATAIAADIPRGPRQVLGQAVKDFRLLRATKYGVGPLVLLFIVDYVQVYDSSIPRLLLPEIRAEFNVSLTTLVLLGQLFVVFSLGSIPLIGWMNDRMKRTRLVAAGNVLSGAFSLTSAFAPNALVYQATRTLDGVGEGIGNVPTATLLYDYYPIEARAKVASLRGVAFGLSTLLAPVAVGAVGTAWGWRVAFMITSPLLIITGLIVLGRLKEPVRGYWERLRAGEDEGSAVEEQPPMRFGEAFRTIMAVKTVRRMLFISPLIAISGGGFGMLYSLFLVEQFRLNPLQRGLLGLPASIVGLFALLMGGALADVLIRHNPGRVLVWSAGLGVVAAFSQILIVVFPSLVLVLAFGFVFAIANSLLSPAQAAVGSLVLPARIRGQGLSVFALAALPTIPFATLPAYIADNYGIRTGLLFYAPLYLVASALQVSAARFFQVDQRAAIASANASNEYKRAKKEGLIKLLLVRDVDVAYEGVKVLFNVDLTVDRGEMIALLGTNGAGKSTLLRAISGTQEADNGAILFDGRNITHLPPHEIARLGIVHMPGGRCVFPSLTVEENLELAMLEAPDGEESARERREAVFTFFPELSDKLGQPAGTLSGGEQQMVGLAQAFLWKPRLLMIDELSLGLAPAVVGRLLEVVRAINAEGATVILVEQSVNVALTVSERAVFMEKGEVRFDGLSADLLRRPDIMRSIYLKGSAALGGTTRVSTGRTRAAAANEAPRTLLEVEDLRLAFGGNQVLDGVTFELAEGAALGLIGPNGAGKTTVFDVVSGLLPPDAGHVRFDGLDITKLSSAARGRLGIVRRFQEAHLFGSLTVFEAICVALDRSLTVRSPFLTALQVGGVRDSERRVKVRADRLVELLELGSYRDKFVSDLSTGLRRVVDLACVLAADPRLLLLDEPSSGVAQAEVEALVPLLRRVRYETKCALLIIEHDMRLVSAVSDELLALVQGRVVTRGAPDEVLEHPVVVEAYLGTDETTWQRSGVMT